MYYSPFRSFIAELILNNTADVVIGVGILIRVVRVVTRFIVVLGESSGSPAGCPAQGLGDPGEYISGS